MPGDNDKFPPADGDRRRAAWKATGEPIKRLSVDVPESLWLAAHRRSLEGHTKIALSDIARAALDGWVKGDLVYDAETGKLTAAKKAKR